MASGGKKPKPPELKVIEGNKGKRSIPVLPDLIELDCDPPEYLDAEGVKVWKRIIIEIGSKNLLKSLDEELLGDYCVLCSLAINFAKDLKKKGGRMKDGKLAPAVQGFRDATHHARLMAAELGLTPSARHRGILPGVAKELDQKKRDAKKYGIG